ncbi:MAG: HD domain-containing protein, partial [Lachnospiraceae bacterium]|nr:HD domain-containing protein [Lachnospiraceae bacterium]
MFELIRAHQLNVMLFLCGCCGVMVLLLFITRFLSKSRKIALIHMESVAFFLLWFDRLAYIYAGTPGKTAYYMVRISNFMVFFLTSAVVMGFNFYLSDWMRNEGKRPELPVRLKVVAALAFIGMIIAVVSAFTGLYYYFDDANTYHRGAGFLIAYIIPVVAPLIQLTVIVQYRKAFGKLIFTSMLLYVFLPLACGILQIFTYGISIVNMAMVAVSVSLYIFAYLDINNTVEHAHEVEIKGMQIEKERMHKLFDQTATAFVSAVEKKDDFTKGTSVRVAEYARKIAKLCGKDEDECERIYYGALLHDVGLIGIPDSVIKNEADPSTWDYEAMRKKPVMGKEILSNITEFPFLGETAYYSHERYDGSGYPEGLSGEKIPEPARIVGVADAFVTMTSRKRYRDARPKFVAREAFVKGAGAEFDPVYAELMVKIIDEESKDKIFDDIS